MIYPLRYLRTLEGKSNAHLIAFSDGREYVVKDNAPGFERTLANEWIAYCLARFLQLPVPYARLVEIPPEFIAEVPEMNAYGVHAKTHFASLHLSTCMDGHQVEEGVKIANSEDMAGILCFDHWLYNSDRTRKNILLQEQSSGLYRVHIIDHAEIFGSPRWSQTELAEMPVHVLKNATHRLFAKHVENEREFRHPLRTIQTMPRHLLEEIMTTLPEDWGVAVEEREALVKMLIRRRQRELPQMLNHFVKTIYRAEKLSQP